MSDTLAIDRLVELVKGSKYMVAMTGAGISTESGIPDFRSSGGIYTQREDAMELLSLSTFYSRPKDFYEFFRSAFLQYSGVLPNRAHQVLAKWERLGKLFSVITQNIDGLHQLAGSKRVLELHGNLRTVHCPQCKREMSMEEAKKVEPYPVCPDCQVPMKPDVVLFEEPLPEDTFREAILEVAKTDLMLVIGTSLTVSPANMLVNYRNPHSKLVIINMSTTPYDWSADLVIHAKAGEVLSQVDGELGW